MSHRRALYPFVSGAVAMPAGMTQLILAAGDIIEVTKQTGSGWWQGTCNGSNGWFPSNYTEDFLPPLPPIPPQAAAAALSVGDVSPSSKLPVRPTSHDAAAANTPVAAEHPPAAVVAGKRSSVVTAKEYAAAALASKAAEEDDMEYVHMRTCILSARVVNHADEGSNTFYVIQCKGGAGAEDAVWEVKRRYSEFEELHQKTQAEITVYFPKKKMNFFSMTVNKKCRRQMKLDNFLKCALGAMTISPRLQQELLKFLDAHTQMHLQPDAVIWRSSTVHMHRRDVLRKAAQISVTCSGSRFWGNVTVYSLHVTVGAKTVMHEKRWSDFCDFHEALVKNGANPQAFPEVFRTAHETAGEEDEGAEEKRLAIIELLSATLGMAAFTQAAQDEVLVFLQILANFGVPQNTHLWPEPL